MVCTDCWEKLVERRLGCDLGIDFTKTKQNAVLILSSSLAPSAPSVYEELLSLSSERRMDALHLFFLECSCVCASCPLLPPPPPVVGAGWSLAPLKAFQASNSLITHT